MIAVFLTVLFATGCSFVPQEQSGTDSGQQSSGAEKALPAEAWEAKEESPSPEAEPAQEISGIGVQETAVIAETEQEAGKGGKSREELEARREEIGLSEGDIAGLKLLQSGNYYYEQCTGGEKTTYVEMYCILEGMYEDILLTTVDAETLARVYQCVVNDHPEFFYLSGYTYTRHTLNGEVQFLTFSGSYLYSEEEVKQRGDKIDEAVSDFLHSAPLGDDYEAVKSVYEYLIYETDYSMKSADNQNICSVFLEHESVCNGYAKAAQYLLNQMGIECIIVNGEAGGAHAWNIVCVDGKYYHMDTTWGDPSYHTDTSESGDGETPDIDYSYLCITTEEIRKSHRISGDFVLPECNAKEADYFVREGLYLESLEKEKLKEIFKNAEESGAGGVMIKACNEEVYNSLYEHLITEQNIFRYYKGDKAGGKYSVAYSGNEDLYTLSFWK